MRGRVLAVLAATVFMLGTAGVAQAGFLGDDLTVNYDVWTSGFPVGPPDITFESTVMPVGAFVEDASFGTGPDAWAVDISDTSIRLTGILSGGVGFTDFAGGFNGIHLLDTDNSIPDISSVTLVGSTVGGGGVNPSDITYDADNIFIDFGGSAFYAGQSVLVDVAFVPEPATVALFALGGLLAIRRRR